MKLGLLVPSLVAILCLEASKATKERKLANKHLRVTVSSLPPALTIIRNSSGHVTGYSGRIMEQFLWIANRLNVTYELRPSPENIAGVKINGTWNGIIGELLRNEVDLGLYAFSVSPQRYEAINFAGYLAGNGGVMVIKYPETFYSFWAVFKPFKFELWLWWVGSLLAVSLTSSFVVFTRLRVTKFKSQIKSLDDMFMYLFGTFTAQGGYYRMGHKSLGILAAFWCYVSFVFVNSYGSVLISYLSVNYKSPEINSMADLAASSKYQMVTMKGTIYEIDVLNATSGHFKILGDKLLRCPSCRTSNFDAVARKVLEGNYVGIFSPSTAKGQIAQDYKRTGKCRLTLAREYNYNWKPMYWGVAKSSPYIEDLNLETMWTVDLGIYTYWNNREIDPRQCLLKYNQKGYAVESIELPRLKLEQFYGAFLLLFIGYLLALVAFLLEQFKCRMVTVLLT